MEAGLKTLQATGDKFQLTRERIRQITANYLRIIKKRNIKGLVNLKRISDILSKLTPVSCINFEKYLIENKYVKKIYNSNNSFFNRAIFKIKKIYFIRTKNN